MRPRRKLEAGLLALATAALILSGCSFEPQRSPNDPGIPEARADAEAQLDAMAARVTFSDEAIVLGTGRGDSCGFGTNWWFGTPASNYRCWMQWVELVVIPDAKARQDVAAALDAEIATMDLPIAGSVVRELVKTHPNNVDGMPVSAGGHDGDVSIGFETEPFRAQSWRSVHVGGSVSASGDIDDVSVAEIEATGATQIIRVTASVEYWAEAGKRDLDAETYVPPAFSVEYSSHGDNYFFDLAQAEPAEAAEVCLADPLVAPTSVTRQQEPFPRITFKLFGVATQDDATRVRDCLATNLSSGTLAWYEPYYRGGETPSPIPTPLPGPDSPL